jgi:hypothetical protein
MEDIMRKLVGIFIAISMLVFAGCETAYYSVTVTNSSSKKVSFSYDGSADSLDPGNSKNYQVEAYTQMPVDISVSAGTLSVAMVHKRNEYIFEDIAPIKLSVANTMPFPVIIKADNYIDADGTGKTELLIPEKAEEKEAKIYTSRPKFTISADYPLSSVKIEWEMKDDTIFVTIK